MGDVGDYWRDHQAYERRIERRREEEAGARAMGMSVAAYRQWRRDIARHEASKVTKRKRAAHTLRCECGKTFPDMNAYLSHKRALGKKAHAHVSAIERQPEPVEGADPFAIDF